MSIKTGTLVSPLLARGRSVTILGFVTKKRDESFDWWSFVNLKLYEGALYEYYKYFNDGLLEQVAEVKNDN